MLISLVDDSRSWMSPDRHIDKAYHSEYLQYNRGIRINVARIILVARDRPHEWDGVGEDKLLVRLSLKTIVHHISTV
jgi:hypothetical protein